MTDSQTALNPAVRHMCTCMWGAGRVASRDPPPPPLSVSSITNVRYLLRFRLVPPVAPSPRGTGFPSELALKVPEGAAAGAGHAANPDVRFAPLMFHIGGVHATLALFAALVGFSKVTG
jgi:hypothetical protein